MNNQSINDDAVLDAVRRAVAETIQIPLADVQGESALLALGAQSIDFADLVLRLEQEYRIQLPRAYAIPNDETVLSYARGVQDVLRGQAR